MTHTMDLSEIRRDYESHRVHRRDLDADPIVQFGLWLKQARDCELLDATAMILATATLDGRPSARVVLLKHFDRRGLCWYTDSRSRKGREMAENPNAALLFHWRDFSRQIRIEGTVEQLPADEAEDYFQSRPEGSRFSAASSHQSSEIASREALEAEVARLRAEYSDGNVPRPEAWIGYRLAPTYFEFWQGQDNRLHDRIVYASDADRWTMTRISP